jgi:hypothetical protein
MRQAWISFKSQRGASLPEVMIASLIIVGGAVAANQVAAHAKQIERDARGKSQMALADAAVDMGAYRVLASKRRTDICLTGSTPLSQAFTALGSPRLGDRQITFSTLNGGSPYAPITGDLNGLPADWKAAHDACLAGGNTVSKGCVTFTIRDQSGGKNQANESRGFVAFAATHWDASSNAPLESCNSNMWTQSGTGLKMTQVVFSESLGADGEPMRKVSLSEPVFVDVGEEMNQQPPVTDDWKQGENLLHGWRRMFDLPPKPGPDFVAWPLPYKRIVFWGIPYVVHTSCSTPVGCPQAEVLGWVCDGTLFAGAKCSKHAWFK